MQILVEKSLPKRQGNDWMYEQVRNCLQICQVLDKSYHVNQGIEVLEETLHFVIYLVVPPK